MADGTSVGSLYYDLSIDDKNLQGQLNDADNKVGNFSKSLQSGLNKAAAGFAIVGAGLTLIAKNATDFTVDLVKSSKALGQQIGTSTEEASRLVAAFGRMGISADGASQMFGIFSKNIASATKDFKDQAGAASTVQLQIEKTQRAIADTTAEIQKTGDKTGDLSFKLKELNNTLANQKSSLSDSANAFEKLGVKTVDAQGNQKDFNTILFEVADKFKAMPDGIDKTADAMALFGRSGRDMIKVLDLGSAGIKDLEDQADKMGLTLTAKNIGQIEDYIQSQKDLKQSTQELKIKIGETTAPVLTEFNKKINDIAQSLLNTDGPMRTATVDVIAFGGPVATVTASLFAFASSVAQVGEAIGFALLGGIALVVAAIAGLIFAIYEMVIHAEGLGTFFVDVTDQISMAWHNMTESLGNDFVVVTDDIAMLWQGMTEKLGTLFVEATDRIQMAISGVAGWFAALPGHILGAIGDTGKLLYNAGKDIIQGLINGIKDKFNDVKNTLGDLTKKLTSWKGPESVDKTLLVKNAQIIMGGFVKGLESQYGAVKDSLGGFTNTLGNSVISPTINPGNNVGGSSGNSTTVGDTIISIGQVNDKSDADYILRRTDRNYKLESMGISPA